MVKTLWFRSHRMFVPSGPSLKWPRKILVCILLVALVLQTLAGNVFAMPQGGHVVGGEANIYRDGTEMMVAQSSERLAIHWDSFDIDADETLTFVQPGASAIALNRVTTSIDPSAIDGRLQANGQVFLINPNGVIFGEGARVDTRGFVASTLDLAIDDFFAGNYRLHESGTAGSIVNHGVLSADEGGYVALLGNKVENIGEIHAPNGSVSLAAGESVTLFLDDSGLFKAEVDSAALGAAIHSGGLIAAGGGHVVLTARAKDALLDTVINHTGIIDASSMEARGGAIVLRGGAGEEGEGAVAISGRLDASSGAGAAGEILVHGDTVRVVSTAELVAEGETAGGFIETSGAVVRVDDGARVSTQSASEDYEQFGTWLIDPNDYVIGPTDPEDGSSYISHETLSSNLEGGHVVIATTAGDGGSGLGNIIVDGAVSWNAGTTLTLKAHQDITLNESIRSTAAGSGLTLLVGRYRDVTLAEGKEIRVGTLTVGGNPDVLTNEWEQIGDVVLNGELHVDTFNIDRSRAGFGTMLATNPNNEIGTLESAGDQFFGELHIEDNDGIDVFLDVQQDVTYVSLIVRTQGDLTLLEGSKLEFEVNGIDIVFVADGGAFINHAGAEAIVLVPEEYQRFFIYSSDPATTVTGGLEGTAIYGKTYEADHLDLSMMSDGISRFLYAPSDQPTLILIAKDQERFYGDANPVFDVDDWYVEGLAEGESLFDVLFGGTPTLATSASPDSPANTAAGYPIYITGDGLTSNKYQLLFQDGTLFVKPAPVTLHIGNAERVYGETEWVAPPSVTATAADGLKLGHTVEDLNITYGMYNQDPTRSVLAPSTGINVTINNPNYTRANPFHTGQLIIVKADLTGQINTATREYGATLSSETVLAEGITWSGFKNGDDWQVVSADFNDLPPETDVGTYVLSVVDPATAINYNVTILDGTLEIIPTPLDIRISDIERIYGDATPAFRAEGLNLRNGDVISDVFSGEYESVPVTTGVGDYDITLTGHTMLSNNYILRNVETGTLTIIPATLVGVIGQMQRVYGDSLTPTEMADAAQNAIAWSGFKNDDDPSVVNVILHDQPVTADVGVHELAGTGSAANYVVILDPGSLMITPAPLVGQLGHAQRTYGESMSASVVTDVIDGITWSGFKNDDDGSMVAVSIDQLPISTNVGNYALTGSAVSQNYSITLMDGELEIIPAVLNLHAKSVTRDIAQPNPSFSMNVSGTKFGETLDSLIRYSVETGVNQKTPAGTYQIVIDLPDSPIAPVGHVILRVHEVLSPNYVLGDAQYGTLTIRGVLKPNVSMSTLCFDCGLGIPDPLKQAAELGRGNEVIEVGSSPTLYPENFLTSDNQSMLDAIAETLSGLEDKPKNDSEAKLQALLKPYLEGVLSGEISFDAWVKSIDQDSLEARQAFAAVLPAYAKQLLKKDSEALTNAERRFLNLVSQKVVERRTDLADRAQQLLEQHGAGKIGLSSTFRIDVPDVVGLASGEIAEETLDNWGEVFGIGAAGGVGAGVLTALFSNVLFPFATVGTAILSGGSTAAAAGIYTATVSAGPVAIVALAIVGTVQGAIIATESQNNYEDYLRVQAQRDQPIDLTSGSFSESELLEVTLAVMDLLGDVNW